MCFKGLFVDSDEIQSTYSYLECAKFEEPGNVTVSSTCIELDPIFIEVSPVVPPFTYSYQCTSVLITSYTPVFLYSYIFLIVFPPVVYFILATYFPDHKDLPDWFLSRLPGILYPDMWSTQPAVDTGPRPSSSRLVRNAPSFRGVTRSTLDGTSALSESVSSSTSHLTVLNSDQLKHAEARQLLRSDNILAPMLMHTSVLLTFGLCCPYLAVTIAMAVLVAVMRWRFLLGRFVIRRFKNALGYDPLSNSANEETTKEDNETTSSVNPLVVKVQTDSGYCDVMENPEMNGMDYCLVVLDETLRDMHVTGGMCLWLQVWVGAMFFGMLCWEITADRRGFWNSLWVPFCALAVPLLLRLYTKKSRERVVFKREREEVTRHTLKLDRVQRHSSGVGLGVDMMRIKSLDATMRFRLNEEKFEDWQKNAAQEGSLECNDI